MSVATDIKLKFPALAEKLIEKGERRIWLEVELSQLAEVLSFTAHELKFEHLSAITGLDEVTNFSVIYHLAQKGHVILNLKVKLDKNNPSIKSVTSLYPCAENYERELVDLLGINVEGLPPGPNYPLPEGWPAGEHPLRKDWKQSNG